MKDIRPEIPALAFISAQIVQEAERLGALFEATHRVESQYQLPSGSLSVMNPAHILGLLYCLIVVPKELWLQDKSHLVFARIDEAKLLSLFSITLKSRAFEKNPSHALLRHLRNAVAHVHFTLVESNFTFWDQEPQTKQETFRATFTLASLSEFLSTVGAALANLRLEPSRVH
jgi:hypothetical protein